MGFFSRYGAFAANSGLEQKTSCITLYTRFEPKIEKKTFDCNPYLFVKCKINNIFALNTLAQLLDKKEK